MAQPTFAEDVLPPEGIYQSRESLLAAINLWARPRGYAFTTGKSTKTPNGRVKVVYGCDRNKPPPSSTVERIRQTSSRRTGCKFSVLAKQSLDGNTWVLSHRPDKECARHNHPPSEDPSAHPAHRRLEDQDAATVSNLATSGATPRDIRAYLDNHSGTIASQRDIYNRIAATRRDMREGQSSIQALVDQLHREGFWCRVRLDPDSRLNAIFFAHPESVAYLQCNPDVLLLDCTYKTNKHRMPLLDMVGVDSCQRSFCIAFAFLSGESEEDYSWALEHLRSLYQRELPSVVLTDRCMAAMNAAALWFSSSKALLCLWHVNKAVLQYCRPLFAPKAAQSTDQAEEQTWDEFYTFWHSIVASPDERIFEERLTAFELKYSSKCLESVGYIKMYWLEPHKEMIVKAWVDKHLHFGNVATSRQVLACGDWSGKGADPRGNRAEGIHSLIKSHIKTSTFDLFDVWQAMKHAISNQLKELQHMRVSQQVRTPLAVSGALFEAVRGWVSHQALRKVLEQLQLLQKSEKTACTQTFTSSHGLPCSHMLARLGEEGRSLLLEHFHPHWHLKRDESQPRPVLEPRRVADQLNARRIQPDTSTRREPSAFEAVEPRKRAPNTCSRCHTVGHIMTSKQCPLRFEGMAKQAICASDQAVKPNADLDRRSASARPRLPEIAPVQSFPSSATEKMNASAETNPGSPSVEVTPPIRSPSPVLSELLTATPPGDLGQAPSAEVADQCGSSKHPPSQYDSPEAIYARYVASRNAWYATQPAGTIKTNQQYRKAKGLPQRYNKNSYEWCLDYKQMSKRCTSAPDSRDWTKEEMMAYLDWSQAEDERVEALVAKEMGENPLANKRRGMRDIWKSVERDSREQQALYSTESEVEQCIIVKT